MSWEIGFVLGLTVVTIALFMTEWFPVDQVAIVVPLVLLAGGVVDVDQALSGLANPATVTIAAMLALSLGLSKTGAVAALARRARTLAPGRPRTRLLLMCLTIAAVSPFLNNTAVVVVFLPVFLALAESAGEPPSRYLIPLSYSAILGGTVSIIGTSTNLIVHGMAMRRGLTELGLFSIAPLGIVYLGIGVLYLHFVGRRLLPDRAGPPDLSEKYGLRDFLMEMSVADESPAIDRRLDELRWPELFDVSIIGIERHGRHVWSPPPWERLQAGDVLWVRGHTEPLLALAEEHGLSHAASETGLPSADDGRLAEVMIGPSWGPGRTLRTLRFRRRHGATVLAIHHRGRPVRARLDEIALREGDLLLVHGREEDLQRLADIPGLIPLRTVDGASERGPRWTAVAILAGVVALAGAGVVDILPAALTGVALMLFTGCMGLDDVYRELDWRVVFLLAGLLPLGVAMDESGTALWLGRGVATHLGGLGPFAIVAGFYLFTSLLTEVMSNNAAALVLTPIAVLTASELQMNPYALLVAVMFGASASFMTPLGYQTNLLVYGPGGYRFTDFVKVGLPLNLLLLAVASLLIPLLWPT